MGSSFASGSSFTFSLFAPCPPFNRVVVQAGLQGTPGGTAAFELEWWCGAHPVELGWVGGAVLECEYY